MRQMKKFLIMILAVLLLFAGVVNASTIDISAAKANQTFLANPQPVTNLLVGSSPKKFDWKQEIPGVNGPAIATTTWDPDANVPQPELLIVGGAFTAAGNVLANNIAAWDGNSWHALGTGVDSDGVVGALTVYKGQLIAGGYFTTAGGAEANNIAVWNGNSWHPLGRGVNGIVSALTVYNSQLIAGGYFTTAGGVDANNIAAWDGNTWKALGNGVDFAVDAFAVYNGQLIAGREPSIMSGLTRYNSVVGWDGSNWKPLGNGLYSAASVLTVYNGQLIAGGQFIPTGGVSANGIGRWDGSSWQPLGSGVSGDVGSLTIYNGQLIVGGEFTTAGGVDANNIAAWDGSSWQPLGSGVGGNDFPYVTALTVYNGDLIVGGLFSTAGGKASAYLASWGPVNQSPVACIVGGDKTLEAQWLFGARVRLDGSCSSDADSTPGTNDDINDFNWYRIDPCNPDNKILLGNGEIIHCNLPLGKNTVVLEVIDKAGASDSNEITVTVQDTTPPEFCLFVWPNILWPPNHKMVKVIPSWFVKDRCDSSPVVSLVGVTTDDKGATKNDIQITNDGSIYLRAEKDRTYTIKYKACDASGNCVALKATITVPHDGR